MHAEGSRSAPLPDDLPVIERSVVRLVVLDTEGRLLLFHTRDPCHPDLGTWWELPGGGIEPGETYRDAAVRNFAKRPGSLPHTPKSARRRGGAAPHSGTGRHGACKTSSS